MKKIFSLIMMLSLWACSNEVELRKSVFIPDPDAMPLPQYSEWGYNTFGIYYDRQGFISDERQVPVKVINDQGVTSFVFSGQLVPYSNYYSSYYSSHGDWYTITIDIPGLDPAVYADLVSLHNTTFDLTSPGCKIEITREGEVYDVKVQEGKFEIKRAQHLLVDDDPEEVILSGIFEFRAIVNSAATTFSNGRFDVGIGNYNFYKL
jgi:hypothetical protein